MASSIHTYYLFRWLALSEKANNVWSHNDLLITQAIILVNYKIIIVRRYWVRMDVV